jgi:hypothetical protein
MHSMHDVSCIPDQKAQMDVKMHSTMLKNQLQSAQRQNTKSSA